MKIQPGSPQASAAQQEPSGGAEATGAGAKRQRTAAQPVKNADTVELSNSLDAELRNRQAEQARRVESIKTLVKAGKYRVSPREVAEKLLSAEKTSPVGTDGK